MATAIVSQPVCPAVSPAVESVRPRASVYDIVTERILAELEKGQVPWRGPWRTLPPANLISKKPYRGINTFLLALAGYGSQYWLTYRQAQALGGNVRKGEHGAKIVFWKFDKYETETADLEAGERTSAFLRYYTVFNLEQTDGLKALLALPPARPIESAEAIVAGMPNPPAFDQGFQASYTPSHDTVTMPSRTAFESQAEYYSTLFHELTHSTGHAKRLAREGFDRPQMFGSESYSREELIAEMGSAMLCGVAGIEQATVANSVAYLKSWIARLKADSRLVVQAASAAQKAADYIRWESPKDSKLDSTDPAPNTIWIFTANDTEHLERRFLSRCKVLEFSSYGLSGAIAVYLDTIWHAEGGNGNAPDLERMAKDSRNSVRDCLMRLEVELMAL